MTIATLEEFAELCNSSDASALAALLEFSNNEPESLLRYVSQCTDATAPRSMLSTLAGSSYFVLSRRSAEANDPEKSADYLENALAACKDIPSDASIWIKIDTWACILGMKRPGRAQDILGKTKLKYLGNRIYPFNDGFALSEALLAQFSDVWLEPNKIVKSAVIFSKVLGGESVRFMLYDVEQPWKEGSGGMAQFEFSSLIVTISRNGNVDYGRSETEDSKSAPKTELPETSSKKCFIATAALGSSSAPEIVTLCAFRDNILARHAAGRLFIRAYYFVSPHLATVVARNVWMRSLVVIFVVKPATSIARVLLRQI
jgi:hypothetical protein